MGSFQMQLIFQGQQDLPSNAELIDSTLSFSNKIFPSINDFFSADDLHVPELHGQQWVLLQGILHEQVNLENLDIASADAFDLDNVLWMDPCILFGNSLFGHHDNPFFQPLINDCAEMISEEHAQ